MALRNRIAVTNAINQENVKNIKSATATSIQTKRAALGEIGNKVNTLKGVEAKGQSLLLSKVQKKPIVNQHQKLADKVTEKPRVQIVKPVLKNLTSTTNNVISNPPQIKKEVESFSSDLLAVEDIDEEDKENPMLMSIYSNNIYAYLRTLEKQFPVEKDFLAGQEVSPKMRGVLIDWLVDVHQQFHLMQETLYLTVAIIDRFLQSYRSIDRKRLQLVGVAAMFIASKYEEMYSPDISDFVYITDNAYTKAEILQMEILIVRTLDYSLGRPLPLHFLRRYSKAGKALPLHHTMAKYFLEQCLVAYEMCHYPPSLIAAAAMYLSFFAIGTNDADEEKSIWTNTLVHYSTYRKEDLIPVVRAIAGIIINADKSKYQAVRKKYTLLKHMRISLRSELKSPTIAALASSVKSENK